MANRVTTLKDLQAEAEQHLNDTLDRTIMAVRDRLMAYFKGDSMLYIGCDDIRLSDWYQGPTNFQYQREARARQSQRLLLIGDVPLAILSKQPAKLTLLQQYVARSPQFEQLGREITNTVERYLPNVELTVDEESRVL